MEARVLKGRALERLEAKKEDLFDLSRRIHAHPEVAYQEVKASQWLKDYLAQNGFEVEEKTGGLATAFRARLGAKSPGLKIAFLAEYDALPEIGHGCGHNLIAAAAVGAGLAVAAVLDPPGLSGQIEIIGTPAEEYTEGKAGKVLLLEAGVFDDVDACLMFHPWFDDVAVVNDLGFMVVEATFKGQAAHAAVDPYHGRNALDGVVVAYNALSALRQQLKSEARLHLIITEGGQAVNVIPTQARARIMFRAPDVEYLEELDQKVSRCLKGAALATETELTPQKLTTVLPTRLSQPLLNIVASNLKQLGLDLKTPDRLFASSDFGNVTQRLPAFAFMIKTHQPGLAWHSAAARDGSITALAHQGMITAAKVMAMSAIDLFIDPQALGKE